MAKVSSFRAHPLRSTAAIANPLNASTLRARRRRPASAAAAYSHALAITGNAQEAESIAATALRRGAHSRIAVIAHARHLALEAAPPADTADVLAPADPRALAVLLAGTRPAVERAIVDAELRYGLDSPSFARVLGIPSQRATSRASAVAQTWRNSLDPALMAWLGPGSCEGLAATLETQGLGPSGHDTITPIATTPVETLAPTGTDFVQPAEALSEASTRLEGATHITVGQLLTAAPHVTEHVRTCEVCSERMRMMTPVRTLVGQLQPEVVPASVALAARASRRRLAGPLPPSIEPRRIDVARARTLVVGAGVLAAVGLGVWGIVDLINNSSDSQAERVARLVDAPAASRLLGTPSVITPKTGTAALANNGNEPILWHATTSAPWLSVSPADGRLLPAQTVSLAVKADASDERLTDASITITGSDGSTQTLKFSPTS